MKAFLQRILQEIIKKIILGTSHTWSMRRSSHWPSNPAYYIEDCRIFGHPKSPTCSILSLDKIKYTNYLGLDITQLLLVINLLAIYLPTSKCCQQLTSWKCTCIEIRRLLQKLCCSTVAIEDFFTLSKPASPPPFLFLACINR